MKSASTKHHGITHLFTGETYINDIINNFHTQKYIREELKGEVFQYLAEMPDEKFLYLFNNGQIRFYLYGVIKNQIRSTTSSFYRTHLRPQILEDEFESTHLNKTITHSTDTMELISIIEEAVNKLDFYRKELFKMYYYDNMSYGQISEFTAAKNPQTRIPKNSIWSAVKSAREEVIEYLKINYKDAFYNDLDLIIPKQKLTN